MGRKPIVGAAQTGPVVSEDMGTRVPGWCKMLEQAANQNLQMLTFSELSSPMVRSMISIAPIAPESRRFRGSGVSDPTQCYEPL